MTDIATTRRQLAELTGSPRATGARIGLVPTMGALHGGHLSLIERARSDCDVVVVSIFVNPIQFGEAKDFSSYPCDLSGDVLLAEKAGVDVCFAPTLKEMYPVAKQAIFVEPGPLGDVLEGASRPGHFRGVATVVAKLFAIVFPTFAYFGEKDFQQLTILRQVTTELSFPITIVSCPTIRESDGLAMSSRNALLSPAERAVAPVLFRALSAGLVMLSQSRADPQTIEHEMAAIIANEPLASLEYAAVRDALTLGPIDNEGPIRLLTAARFGSVRLIDNLGTET